MIDSATRRNLTSKAESLIRSLIYESLRAERAFRSSMAAICTPYVMKGQGNMYVTALSTDRLSMKMNFNWKSRTKEKAATSHIEIFCA